MKRLLAVILAVLCILPVFHAGAEDVEGAVYTLFDCPKDHLEPSGAYGSIYPYTGGIPGGERDSEAAGFFNGEGRLITDSIYSDIVSVCFGKDGEDFFWDVAASSGMHGIVSKDGSFASDFCYSSVRTAGEYILAVRDSMDFDLYDAAFHLAGTQYDFAAEGKRLMPKDHNGSRWICTDSDGSYYLTDEISGEILLSSDHFIKFQDPWVVMCDDAGCIRAYDQELTPAAFWGETLFRGIVPIGFGFTRVILRDGREAILNADGNMFAADYDIAEGFPDDCFSVRSGETQTIYTPDGEPLFQNIPSVWNYLGNGIFYEFLWDALEVHDAKDGSRFLIDGGSYITPYLDAYCVTARDGLDWSACLMRKDGKIILQGDWYFQMISDLCNRGTYLKAVQAFTPSAEQRLLSSDGERELFAANGVICVMDGNISVADEQSFSCYSPDGELFFRYLFGRTEDAA